jgi:integrase
MAERLSESAVKNLPAPKTGATTVWDEDLTGFGVRVFAPTARRPEGARSFFINYRIDGVERRFTIGSFPNWSCKAARSEAKTLRQRIDRGEDPTVDKRERRTAPTVADLAERYRNEHLRKKAASSQKNDWAMIEKEILPRLKTKKVADVHQGDIAALHSAITARGTPVRANRVLAVASKMFAIALKPMEGESEPWRDQAQGNPCKGVERNQEEGHERFFSEAELAALSDVLDAYSTRSTADCVRLIMLTGCRPGEAMLATWDQFDAEPSFWVKPSSQTKQRKMHRFPLSPAASELITRAAKRRDGEAAGSAFVFPGQKRGEPLKQLRTIWETISQGASVALWASSSDKKIATAVTNLAKALRRQPSVEECKAEAARRGLKLPAALTDARLYDLRHSFASVGAAGGLSLQIIGRLLGHTQARTTQRYSHLADDPLRDAATKIAAVISGAGKKGADVVSLRRSKA